MSLFNYIQSFLYNLAPSAAIPAGVTLREVEHPSDELIEAFVKLYLDLMKDTSPAMPSLCGGDLSLADLMAHGELRAGALAGEIFAAFNEKEEMVGYALTMPPGRQLYDSEEQRELGHNEFLEKLSEEGKEYYRTSMAEFAEWSAKTTAPITVLNSYFVHLLMVREEYQGKGIGTGIINLIKDKAAKNGDPVGLATDVPNNVEVYRHMGFKVGGPKAMPSPWGDWQGWVFTLETST